MKNKYMAAVNNCGKWCIKNIALILKYSFFVWILMFIITQDTDISMLLPNAIYQFGDTIYKWIDGNVWLNAATFFIFTLIFIYIQTKIQTIRIDTNTCLWLLVGILSLNTIPVWYPLNSIIGISYNRLITAAAVFLVAEHFYYLFKKDSRCNDENEETAHPVFSLTTKEDDLADTGWQSYANSLVSMLPQKEIRNESMAVGIYGDWGTGKTTFLQHVCKELEQRYVIIEFNPWGCLSAESVITDFFNNMKQNLSNNNELGNAIEEYMNMLTTIEIPDWIKWLTDKIAGNSNDTTASMKKKVEERLKDSDKPVAILIDDIDRLEADEVFEVLRLIRITANFCNTVFIAAYDKNHVCEMLHSKGIESAERYIEKVFNVEISLPNLESKTIPYIIRDEIYKMTLPESNQRREIKKALYQYTDSSRRELLVSHYIHNFREAKRFAALFALNFNHIKKTGTGEFNLFDLFWLELLHFCCNDEYKTLATNPFEILQSTKDHISKESRWATYLTLKNAQDCSSNILKILFNSRDRTRNDHRCVCFTNSYAKYFCYRMPSHIIPLVEFHLLMHSESLEEITDKINEWGNQNQFRSSLTLHLAQFNIYHSEKEYVVKNYITALIAAHPYIGKTEELNIYHNKFLSSCCRNDIKDFFYKSLKSTIEQNPSDDWNDILSSMIASQYYDAPDDIDYERFILKYEEIKLLMELNMDKYIEVHGKPQIHDISDANSDFHKFLIAASYIWMYYPSNGNNSLEKSESYSNPLYDKLLELYKGGRATDFKKFIKPFTVIDYENEDFDKLRIAELTEKLFCSNDKLIQFIKYSFEPTDEVDKFISENN